MKAIVVVAVLTAGCISAHAEMVDDCFQWQTIARFAADERDRGIPRSRAEYLARNSMNDPELASAIVDAIYITPLCEADCAGLQATMSCLKNVDLQIKALLSAKGSKRQTALNVIQAPWGAIYYDFDQHGHLRVLQLDHFP
jgi:hypothetical protein